MSLDPVIILVRPQMGENIGAAARSMLNFGLTDLRIVAPRDGWPNPKAADMAKGAKQVIYDAKIYDTLKEACLDIKKLYATTARPRDMVKPELSPVGLAQNLNNNSKSNLKSAILFGPERTGLSNEDLNLADAITIVPVADIYPSLNLAQAVSIISYQWYQFKTETMQEMLDTGKSDYATKAELEGFFEHLEESLDQSDFFRVKDKKPKMLQNIKNIFVRSNLTNQEVRTLRGIIRSLVEKK